MLRDCAMFLLLGCVITLLRDSEMIALRDCAIQILKISATLWPLLELD
jgi:hypothetical protein